jgi:hypothetical protein
VSSSAPAALKAHGVRVLIHLHEMPDSSALLAELDAAARLIGRHQIQRRLSSPSLRHCWCPRSLLEELDAVAIRAKTEQDARPSAGTSTGPSSSNRTPHARSRATQPSRSSTAKAR